eukprot:COSAG03_NODE_8486_length_798_cov_0.719599_2_plen_112_part_01
MGVRAAAAPVRAVRAGDDGTGDAAVLEGCTVCLSVSVSASLRVSETPNARIAADAEGFRASTKPQAFTVWTALRGACQGADGGGSGGSSWQSQRQRERERVRERERERERER